MNRIYRTKIQTMFADFFSQTCELKASCCKYETTLTSGCSLFPGTKSNYEIKILI